MDNPTLGQTHYCFNIELLACVWSAWKHTVVIALEWAWNWALCVTKRNDTDRQKPKNAWEKPVLVSPRPPQIPHGLTWVRTPGVRCEMVENTYFRVVLLRRLNVWILNWKSVLSLLMSIDTKLVDEVSERIKACICGSGCHTKERKLPKLFTCGILHFVSTVCKFWTVLLSKSTTRIEVARTTRCDRKKMVGKIVEMVDEISCFNLDIAGLDSWSVIGFVEVTRFLHFWDCSYQAFMERILQNVCYADKCFHELMRYTVINKICIGIYTSI